MKFSSFVPACSDPLPSELTRSARQLAEAWIHDPTRPTVAEDVRVHWKRLVEEWIQNADMPLYVRKFRGNRGQELTHTSGRILVPVDNSTAHWAFASALQGQTPSLPDVRALMERDEMPVAMAFTKVEREAARFTCNRNQVNLNTLGWKVCHIEPVGMKSRGEITQLPIEVLLKHFRRYLSPTNMFLVPKIWSGLGEMPEMIEASAKHDRGGEKGAAEGSDLVPRRTPATSIRTIGTGAARIG